MRNYGAIKLVSFAFPQSEQSIETVECGFGNPGKINIGQPQSDCYAAAGRNLQFVVCRGFGAHRHGSNSVLLTVHDVIVDTVLHACASVLDTVQPLLIRLILSEENFGRFVAIEPSFTESGMLNFDTAGNAAHVGTLGVAAPRPGIAEPDGGEEAQRSCFGPTVGCGDFDQNVFNIALRVLHANIEIAIISENAGTEQFEFRLVFSATAVLFD